MKCGLASDDENAVPKSVVQMKAEAIELRGLHFDHADPDEVVSFLRRKGIDQDRSWGSSTSKGVNLIYLPTDCGVQLVTVSWKRRMSLWSAIKAAARHGGLEVSVRGSIIVLHGQNATPSDLSVVDELHRSPGWERAASNSIDRVQFAGASLSQISAWLTRKLWEADLLFEGLEIKVADGTSKEVSLDMRNVQLSELLWCVAELSGTEIVVQDRKVILKPTGKSGKWGQGKWQEMGSVCII